MSIAQKYLLNDKAMRDFIVNGYVQVEAESPTGLHQSIYQQIEDVFAKEGNPGNNLLPRIPDIQRVFDHPAVVGALTSLLGPGYVMHPHRYCHLNQPGGGGQGWHKDDYVFDNNVRHPSLPLGDGVLLSAGCDSGHGADRDFASNAVL